MNLKIKKEKPSEISKFRKKYLNRNIELINITSLCEPKLGCSGSCNDINDPDETIHHIQFWYRDEIVANMGTKIEIMDDNKYCVFLTEPWTKYEAPDFIIFRKVKIK